MNFEVFIVGFGASVAVRAMKLAASESDLVPVKNLPEASLILVDSGFVER